MSLLWAYTSCISCFSSSDIPENSDPDVDAVSSRSAFRGDGIEPEVMCGITSLHGAECDEHSST
eukprot:CAMPEP_0179224868 /NCGR_PEP_ID=MMETSP0797-20121207/8014_1 /TAXON_ID=47934 /ORGANISM="Dinophysis acuminata, Strain DAEP01" /LENGTH=63 /DNA_ID=CAMNT_0020931867 /DNA_START=313 /DNA_END=501 /DNA_ORIENTATION=+